MTDNLIPAKVDAWGVTANESDVNRKDICLWSVSLNDSDFKDLQVNSIYNTLILKADFKCLLANYRMKSGTYGLRLRLVQKATNDNIYPVVQEIELDSGSMFGNPYSFLVYSTQEATFDISNIGTIDAISLYLYQNNDFEYYKHDGLVESVPEADFDNILVKNIYLSFGSDLTKIEDNTLQIFTGDSAIYNGDENSSNSREIGLLWYNKNEDNTYIGFSDGIYDPTYDEIQYLKDTEQDSRLVSQLGKDVPTDEAGLTVSADLEEVLPLLKTLRDTVTRDLNTNVRAFQEQVQTISQATNLGNSFTTVLNSISTTGKTITDSRDTLKEEYTAILSAARKIQDNLVADKPRQTVTFTTFERAVNNLIQLVNSLMTNANTLIKKDYTGYMSVYDTYKARIDKVIESLNRQLTNIGILISDDASVMNRFFEARYTFIPYVKEDLSGYANKYCIYWYRYQPNYYDVEERFMEKGWRRLEDVNLGIPREKLSDDSVYNAKKTLSDSVFVADLNTEMVEEKFIAVLFYNHTMYKSNIITFTNANPPVDEKTADLANGACRIEHSDNSQPSYQVYGLNNLILNVADVSYKRKLLVRYEGLNTGDEMLYGAQVFWYVPTNTTMLSYDVKDFSEEWSNDGGTAVGAHSKQGFICFYRTIGGSDIKDENGDHLRYEIKDADRYFIYRIKDYYSQTFTRNTIECKVILMDGTVLETDISFVFSSFGTSGTDYTLVVSPRTTKPAVDYNAEANVNLPLGLALYDYNNERLKIYDTAANIGTEDFVPYLSSLRWLGPTAYNAVFTYLEGEKKFGVENIDISVRGDKGPNKGYYPGILEVTVPYMVEEVDKEVDLVTVYPIPYRAGDYYIEGASVVVYQSDGTNPGYYKNPFKIFRMDTNEEITTVKWSIVCYDEDGNLIEWGSKKDPVLEGFMPKLDSQNRLVPCHIYLEDNADGNKRESYPVVLCTLLKQNDEGDWEEDDVLWAQPIYCIKNRYASAMLNKWDGRFQIDEENGTILSTMLGAGRKNNQNQFEGILMGDVGSASEDNASGVGLYGFHNGAQSFNFNVDGTAFIGKSGRGRIKFNGDTGSITSASYEETKESAGMKIDLDDGYIDIRGVSQGEDKKYSKYESSSIRIDVKSPYLTVRSELGNELVHIGHDKYQLKSDQYNATSFHFNETQSNGLTDKIEDNETETGMLIDLKTGQMDAYRFQLLSKNIYLNSKEKNKPYFAIKDDANNLLMYVDTKKYWLKSADYSEDDGVATAGIKIDLAKGHIDAFDFTLTSNKVILSTKSPYFKVSGTRDDGQPLMLVSDKDFYIQDNDGNMTIDLDSGSITATNFDLSANGLNLSSNKSKYPISVDSTNNFYVDWAGNVHCSNLQASGGSFTGTIHASEGEFTGDITGATGTFSGLVSGGSININDAFIVAEDGTLTIGGADTFQVTPGGALSCTSGTIGGWTVQPNNGGFNAGNFTVSPGGLTYTGTGGGITVGSDGSTTIDKLTVTDTAYFSSCNVTINAAPGQGYPFVMSGDAWIGGHLGIYTKPEAAYGLSIHGDIKIAGNLLFTGNLYVGSQDESHRGLDKTIIFYNGWKKHTLTFSKGVFIGLDGDFDADGGGIPALESGKFLSNNGSELVWKSIGVTVANKSNTTVSQVNNTTYKVEIPFSKGYSGTTSGHNVKVYCSQSGVSVSDHYSSSTPYVASNTYVWADGEKYKGTASGSVSGQITATVVSD